MPGWLPGGACASSIQGQVPIGNDGLPVNGDGHLEGAPAGDGQASEPLPEQQPAQPDGCSLGEVDGAAARPQSFCSGDKPVTVLAVAQPSSPTSRSSASVTWARTPAAMPG